MCLWTSGLLPCPSCCKQCCDEHWRICVLLLWVFVMVVLTYADWWCWWWEGGRADVVMSGVGGGKVVVLVVLVLS